MQNDERTITSQAKPAPWNKGKLIGAKPPLRPKHVWSIRTKLQVDGRIRDLALFDLAIDSKLRGSDVVRLRVEDVVPHGATIDRATVSPAENRTSRSLRGDRADSRSGRPVHSLRT